VKMGTTDKLVVRTCGLTDRFVVSPDLIIDRGGVEVPAARREEINSLCVDNEVPVLWSDDEDAPEALSKVDETKNKSVPATVVEVK